jgi:hypothetical protein
VQSEELQPQKGARRFVENVGNGLPDYTVSQTRGP